jgi:hypothetical protein
MARLCSYEMRMEKHGDAVTDWFQQQFKSSQIKGSVTVTMRRAVR